jgi:hypothetical protein
MWPYYRHVQKTGELLGKMKKNMREKMKLRAQKKKER